MSNPTLAPIYDRLAGTDNYHPFTAETFADWASEPGDTVRISRGGTEYEAPVHAQTILWRGKTTVQMESAGTKDREPIERTSNRKYNGTSSGQSNARTTAGMMGGLVADNKHLLYVVEDPQNGLVHKFEVTAEALTSEITRATQAENGLQVDISSLEQDISGVRTTVGTIEGQVVTMAGTLTSITGSALWTQRNEITGVVGEFAVIETGGTKTLVVKSGGGLKIRRDNVEYGVYMTDANTGDTTLTAGVVATIVNGTPSTNIYADKILMSSASGANTVQVEVNGKITAQDITAQFIQSKISDLGIVSVANLASTGGITCGGGNYGISTFGIGTLATLETTRINLNGSSAFTDCVVDASVANNTLTLTKASGATVTFSKATSLTAAWSGDTFTVTATPGGSKSTMLTSLGASSVGINPQNNKQMLVDVVAVFDGDGGEKTFTAANTPVGASAVWDAAEAQFTAVSLSTVKNTSAIRIDDTAVTLYEAGSGTIYDRGESVLGRETVSSGGYMYYPAGTATTYYNAGTVTRVDRGNTVVVTPISSTSAIRLGSSGTYYTAGTKVRKIGNKPPVQYTGTLYVNGTISAGSGSWYLNVDVYEKGDEITPVGNSVTARPVVSSGGTIYYTAAAQQTWYKGDGGSFTQQGTSVSVTPISSSLGIRLSAQQTYYRGDGGAYTPQGTAQDAYKKVSSGGTIYYQANAQATYYTKQ